MPERPRAVDIALVLLAINIAVGVISLVSAWRYVSNGSISGFVFLEQFVSLILLTCACLAIARGRNWARIVLLALTALAMFSAAMALRVFMRYEPWGASAFPPDLMRIFTILQPSVLGGLACYLLFFSSGNWFRKR
jgi:hypothetical protein